ncbi:NADP-dependent isocitrate dehydrogenase [Aurantiacibacter gangjinensis]|uniref:Isocitrate dehydrogenase [NADP] n=1 Tax=Aurantiacibacter gangjinensis TaxID=502682 RepID=A0A0G9MM29_9SPHN|nr:NADP-dependent isocitrate dehydrogenase [Aurantiacibacter gangjinensis]APE27745.1 Isocitrate dehydrogenase [NADP] [Aurantiacibacter gangjinensis]KLE31745.1 isocitrate dehydrogenase [Aurantiacibacter gangjinensis]
MTETVSSDTTRLPIVAVAAGDGIGLEITAAAMRVMEAAGARFDTREIALGEALYKSGHSSGIGPDTWDTLAEADALFKGPITTPLGSGYKSLNVTLRKTLGLFANVRPCRSLHPAVSTLHPELDIVIVRENEEDLYAGIEHRQTHEVYQTLKLVSRPGTERIIRYAFDYCRANGRKKLTCFTKSNIMKLTDGLMQNVFEEIGKEYPDIEQHHMIIDIASARLAARPQDFDVIVTSNLYGDIVSDIAAELTGSVGLGASANIGAGISMFEAIHGSAPDIAGQKIANPSGLILAGVMMLNHLGQGEVAGKIHNAWLKTIEDGLHTGDIYRDKTSKEQLGTQDFADAVIARLGQQPQHFAAVDYTAGSAVEVAPHNRVDGDAGSRKLVGVDVFVMSRKSPQDLAEQLQQASTDGAELKMLTNRGIMVWPSHNPATFCTDHWRCRFQFEGGAPTNRDIVDLLGALTDADADIIKTEHLYEFDGQPGYSLGQGQ